jgi:trigger factor
MRVERTDKGPTSLTLSISADTQDLEPIKGHVLSHFSGQVKVPGFRAGKAPAHLLEKNVNQRAMLDEFMEHAINDLYLTTLKNQKIRPVAEPDIKLKKFVPYSLLEFEAELEIIGQISLPDYKKIKLAKPKASVGVKDVNEVVESLRLRQAERQAAERPAKNGDEVIIDFSGKDDGGKLVAGAEAKDYPLVLGSSNFIPGFEEQLEGLKTSEEKKFDVTFPNDYNVASLQNKKVTFDVKLKQVNELKMPVVDNKFAAKAGPFKNLTELKGDIKKQLTSEKQSQLDRQYENELVQMIVVKSKVEIPSRLIDEQVERLEEEEKRNLVYQGQTWQEHLKVEGVTEEEHRQRQRPKAEERVKGGLVLSDIADKENLQVRPEELEIRVQILKSQYQDPQMQAELDKSDNRQDVAARLLTEKTLQALMNYASNN